MQAQPISFIPIIIDDDCKDPGGICMEDINGDGHLDVLAASIEDNSVIAWLNNGEYPVVWEKQIIDTSFDGAIYVSSADVDGDSLMDILGASYYGHEVAWWKNEGGNPILWTKQAVTSDFHQAHEVMSFDVDQDGDMDVLAASAGYHRISWFENKGGLPVEWTEHIVGTGFGGARSVDAKDMDADGDIDICGASLDDNEICWWRNEGGQPLVWTKILITNQFELAHKVQIIDMDLDGDMDILGTAYQAGISWFNNENGDGSNWSESVVSTINSAVIALAVDLDKDGDLDIAGTAQGGGFVGRWENLDNNSLNWHYKRIEFFSGAWPLDYGDLDGDGDMDLVCGGNDANMIKWYNNELITGMSSGQWPVHFKNFKVYPIPFDTYTQVVFDIQTPGFGKLTILDAEGRQIRQLQTEYWGKGSQCIQWDGKDQNHMDVANGLYYGQIDLNSKKKMLKIFKMK